MPSSRFIDSLITYRILRLLVTPFSQTEAYRLGIIDDKGRLLKGEKDLTTAEEKNAYTLLHRLVFRLKRIIEKVPVENKKLLSFAAALALIREFHENDDESLLLERKFISYKPSTEEVKLVENFLNNKYKSMMKFKHFVEEAPANNAAATPGVAGFTPDTVGIKIKPKIYRRKKKNDKRDTEKDPFDI